MRVNESAFNNWSVRTLDRNISTLYYERILLSKSPTVVINEMMEKTTNLQQDNFEFIKNPYVLEFLDLPNNINYKEAELEQAILDNMQNR
jgi:predicted nuclease of restriction endonuclease-like (RecB) superfamily